MSESKCKGLLLRCRVNQFSSDTKMQFKTTFSILKRMSCNGSCVGDSTTTMCISEWFFEDLREGALDDGLVLPETPKDFGIYRVDAEESVCDEIEYHLVLVDENKNEVKQ